MKTVDRELRPPVNEDRVGTIHPPGVDPVTGNYRGRDVTTVATFTLAEVTEVAAKPYAAALKEKNVERALRIFTDGLVDGLKALPARPVRVPMRVPMRSDE